MPFTSLLFKTPLELITVVCLLLYLIGWQPLMGVLFILMLIPVGMIISYFCAWLGRKLQGKGAGSKKVSKKFKNSKGMRGERLELISPHTY